MSTPGKAHHSATERSDRVYKVRPLIEQVRKSNAKLWSMLTEIVIDESMIRCTSRWAGGMSQYNSAKPIKHGLKVFVICCGVSNFIYNFEVYQHAGPRRTSL